MALLAEETFLLLHAQTDTPKENQLSNICVLDRCGIKRALEEAPEEDEPHKRSTKCPGEEQSSSSSISGISGSSCMSAPASDSHQGGSSVVAFSGYKGQTPNLQCQTPQQQGVSSSSESTLPLLESKERLDKPPQEAGGEGSSQQEALEPLDFCPVLEGSSAGSIPASLPSNYRPQLSGYRPQ